MAIRVSDPEYKRISEPQIRRLWALAYSWSEASGFTKQDAVDRLTAVVRAYGFDSAGDVTSNMYQSICDHLEAE